LIVEPVRLLIMPLPIVERSDVANELVLVVAVDELDVTGVETDDELLLTLDTIARPFHGQKSAFIPDQLQQYLCQIAHFAITYFKSARTSWGC
jgi:hypothetical protein